MAQYVKCISTKMQGAENLPGEINKIYKINKEASNNDWILKGIPYSVSKIRFTFATEEEYNIQEGINKPIVQEDMSYLIPILNEILCTK